jgi:hypothetical protein
VDISAEAWRRPTSDHEAAVRAGGRRRYNSVRRFRAELRRVEILRLASEAGGFRRGFQAMAARRLGVSEATISSDMRGILGGRLEWCPLCGCGGHVLNGQLQPVDRDEDLDDEVLDDLLGLQDQDLEEP